MKIVDLRHKEPGCTGHPIIRFSSILRNLKESEVLLIVNPEDIPIKVVELVVGKHGYKVVSINKKEEKYAEIKLIRE